MFVKPDNWKQLTPVQKQKLRLDHWEKSEGVVFESAAAETGYRERIHRLRTAYDLSFPDRIIADLSMGAGEYALRRAGLDGRDMLYNHEKFLEPIVSFNKEFQPDTAITALPYPGRIFDILDFKTYIWAGQKLPDHLVIQAWEEEYMRPDEYKDFIADPSGFWMKSYLPRMFGALGPMSMMPDWPRISEIVDVGGALLPYGLPPVQEMLKKMMSAGEEALKWVGILGQMGGTLASAGFPSMPSTFLKNPFDFLGDTLRGTKGIMMDLFRRPKDVIAACEAYVPVLVNSISRSCDMMGTPVAMYPLHKGADGFMSQKQFETFYWPTFKAVMLGLWEEGITNYLFVEGSYNSRLETIAEMPEGSAVWHFDKTDMRKAKEILGDKFLLMGNVPASLMSTGSTEDLRAYCDGLVDLFGGSRGFIMAFGCGFEWTTDAKVRAFLDSVRR